MSAKRDIDELVGWLESSGFTVTSGKHWKMRHPSRPDATATMPKTPSDYRSVRNTRSQLREVFQGVDVDWDGMPGLHRHTASRVCDRLNGDQVVALLDELVDPKGKPAFVERISVRSENGHRVLTIRNPFHLWGSRDPLRRTATVAIQLPNGNQRLNDLAVSALQGLGVDLTLADESDVSASFAIFARQQRTARIFDHEARMAEQHRIGRTFPSRPAVGDAR